LYYWENIPSDASGYQNWDYQWNAMWFVFVSMTTVGYGDFYPKTQFGRSITLLACLVGVYFVSMMMVFLTKKSIRTEREEKAYKLITRLKYRELSRELRSKLIFNYLNMLLLKNKSKTGIISEDTFQNKYTHHRRCIINIIQDLKDNTKDIRSCDMIPTKEQLEDISEKLDADIKAINEELETIKSTILNKNIRNKYYSWYIY
jgi:hypothetical protein